MLITYTENKPQEVSIPADTLAGRLVTKIIEGGTVPPTKYLFEVTGAGLKACHEAVGELKKQRDEWAVNDTELQNIAEGIIIGLTLAAKFPKNAHQAVGDA